MSQLDGPIPSTDHVSPTVDSAPSRQYRAIARWDGELWQVRAENLHGSRVAETTALRLERVDLAVRAAVRELGTGADGGQADVRVEVELPGEAYALLATAEQHVRTESRNVDQVVALLARQHRISLQDVATLLRHRHLHVEPARPLLVSNREVAVHALAHRPDVVAVVWEDAGFGVTTYCRRCVDDDRSPWADLPHGNSALVYDPPVYCDNCDRDIEATADG